MQDSGVPRAVFRDEKLLVIDKPPKYVVNRAETQKGRTLEDWILETEPALAAVPRAGIVHRLDKETSGLLVVARDEETQLRLMEQFKERHVEKRYLTLLHGNLFEETAVSLPVGRNPRNRERFAVLPTGKEAYTRFVPQEWYTMDPQYLTSLGIKLKQPFLNAYSIFTYCEVFPRTGRTHQIRVHAKHLGQPVVSDDTYGGRNMSRIDRNWCPRLFLHATFLSLTHPHSGIQLYFESPLPPDLQSALAVLTKRLTT